MANDGPEPSGIVALLVLLQRGVGYSRKWLRVTFSILKSGNRDAYYVAFIKLAVLCMAPVNRVMALLEMTVGHRGEPDGGVPLVLVTGIQRSGTTLIAQVIAETFPFFPVGNVCSVFSRSSLLVHLLIRRLFFQRKSHDSFTNYYGFSRGVWSIGDCYEVWDRWLGRNHYWTTDGWLEKNRNSIRKYFADLEKIYQLPVISKNNRNTLIMTSLAEVFPNSFFIITRRDPIEVILSTLEGSQHFYGNSRMLWGLRPDSGFNESVYMDRVDAACFQQAFLEKRIEEQLKHMEQDRYHVVDYESFCEDPEKELRLLYDRLQKRIPVSESGIRFIRPTLTAQRASVADELRERVRTLYQRSVQYVEEAPGQEM